MICDRYENEYENLVIGILTNLYEYQNSTTYSMEKRKFDDIVEDVKNRFFSKRKEGL